MADVHQDAKWQEDMERSQVRTLSGQESHATEAGTQDRSTSLAAETMQYGTVHTSHAIGCQVAEGHGMGDFGGRSLPNQHLCWLVYVAPGVCLPEIASAARMMKH
eukprot:scaffold47199_cov28-Tisochrysis_lutea.AAC.1